MKLFPQKMLIIATNALSLSKLDSKIINPNKSSAVRCYTPLRGGKRMLQMGQN